MRDSLRTVQQASREAGTVGPWAQALDLCALEIEQNSPKPLSSHDPGGRHRGETHLRLCLIFHSDASGSVVMGLLIKNENRYIVCL